MQAHVQLTGLIDRFETHFVCLPQAANGGVQWELAGLKAVTASGSGHKERHRVSSRTAV